MRIRRTMIFIILSALLTACNLPSNESQYDFNQVSTFAAQTVAAAGTSLPQTPQPTTTLQQDMLTPPTQFADTPAPTQTGTPCNRAAFVADVTVPDDTPFFVEKEFTKTWRLRNAGTCAWTTAYQLVFDSGYRMSAPLTQPLTTRTIQPGETLELSVDLIAPALRGTYRGNWKIKAPSGETFALASGPFWVQVRARPGSIVVWRTLKQGDSNSEVYAVQSLLRHHGLTPLVDGVFGPDTRTQLRKFQNRKDISDDGIVGPETWEVLVVQVSQGSNGDAVRAVQYLLRQKFGYTLEVDSIFGPITAEAVKDFQSKQGLTPDGVVDPLTWQKLIGK